MNQIGRHVQGLIFLGQGRRSKRVTFFFCGRSAVLQPSVRMLPGIGWCGAGLLLLLLRSTSRAATLSPHVARNWVVQRRSSAVPHSLLVVDSSCGHNWCLCFRQMGQSWRMWWTVCSASLQWQSAESMMPVRFRCARRPQCPVCNLNIVVCSCLARRLIGSVEGL